MCWVCYGFGVLTFPVVLFLAILIGVAVTEIDGKARREQFLRELELANEDE